MGANVAELVYQQALLRPASPAIITQEQVITYGRLQVAVGAVAAYLKRSGITPSQVVGVSMGQNPLHIITLLALAQIGAVSLPLHIAVPAERRTLAARRFGASCVVSGLVEMALPGLQFVSLAGLSFDGISIPPDTEMHPVDSDAPFRIAISSGTSGDPKGMVLTHGLMGLRNHRREPGFAPLSRMVPMDMAFIAGFATALRTFTTGAALVLPTSMRSEDMLHSIVSHGVTHILLSPAQACAMADQLALDDPYCPSLVNLKIVGGPLVPGILSILRKKLSPNILVGYGSTETGAISVATPEILDRQPASVGMVHPWVRVEIVDANDRLLPNGSIGLVRIRSEHQVTGYYLDERRSREHFRHGWFYPGDLGGFNEEGLLYLEGRVDDQLNVGGTKVNPEDIDAILASHPNVIEAGSFVLSAEEGAELLAVAITLREQGNLDEIQAHALTKLGPLAPARYFAVPSLPRTITGKLRRGELTAQFSKPETLH